MEKNIKAISIYTKILLIGFGFQLRYTEGSLITEKSSRIPPQNDRPRDSVIIRTILSFKTELFFD